ncbi:alanine dehydrogenase [Telmatospirillum sp.]|uniref:alanine dehydrogenase n=1 Tax=Telmatospirillum sp. TaxID=2079197 RepID=UPI002846D5FA|nr:alanine dehydrogenase [Telmatospirillum sp.]MDR3439790.1 alanine dehydrogenase [Telmatospirillum sp.]
MRIGVPKEIKVHEYRVGLTPESVAEIVTQKHSVVVETAAGTGIGCSDDDYKAAGATVVASAQEVFAEAELIVKVKEPEPAERRLLNGNHVLFTYLHLAPFPDLTMDLLNSGAVCIAYETITDAHGHLPLLAPMSQVAGRMAIQAGAYSLEKAHGGRGILFGRVPGVRPARVTVIGGGVVGESAVETAIGLGADVMVLDNDLDVLERLAKRFGWGLRTVKANRSAVASCVAESDLVIGAVLVKGASAPKVVTREMVASMRPGSVVVDVAIDQGGCFETSRPTTHADPTYVEEGVVHHCVVNMAGAVPWTATYALNNATLPYILQIADQGYRAALLSSPYFLSGLNIHHGCLTEPSVAREQKLAYIPPEHTLAR